MKWLPGTKVVRFRSLVLPDDFADRLIRPNVIELADSFKRLGGAPGNPPWVEWESKVVCAGGDRLAALVLNGLVADGASPDTDGMVEIRAFEGTPEEVEKLRAEENIRRRQDRDAWLAKRVDEEARAIAKKRVAKKGPKGDASPPAGVPSVPPEAAAGTADAPPRPANLVAGPAHKWVHNEPYGVACGSTLTKKQGALADFVADWDNVTCPKCLALGREWGSVAPEPPPAVTKADKVEARKKVAKEEKTTPAAVKQAAHRQNKREGKTTAKVTKHDDSAPALSKSDLETQRALIDVEASVSQAVVRLRNFAKKRPDAGQLLALDVRLEKLSDWLKSLTTARKGHGL